MNMEDDVREKWSVDSDEEDWDSDDDEWDADEEWTQVPPSDTNWKNEGESNGKSQENNQEKEEVELR